MEHERSSAPALWKQVLPAWARPSAPLFVHLIVTRICSWSCPFCVIKNNGAGMPDGETLIAVVKRLSRAGVMDVTLFGGEPLLHPKVLDIGMAIQDCGMKPGFVSNGDVPVSAKAVAQVFPQASVSIHGPENVHDKLVGKQGAWRHAVSFVKEYTGNGGKASICVTVGRDNLDAFAEFCLGISEEIPLISFVVNPVIPFPGASTALRSEELSALGRVLVSLASELSSRKVAVTIGSTVPFCALPPEAISLATSCFAGTLFATVDYLGDVHICPERNAAVGNIFADGLKKIWRKKSEYDTLATASFADEPCKGCSAYAWCLGGCRSTTGGAAPTTDKRAVGPDAARRNIELASEAFADAPPCDHVGKMPRFVRKHPRARTRIEPFGMFVVSRFGQPLALDSVGRKFFSRFLDGKRVDWLAAGKKEGFSKEEAMSFISQGLQLGIFTNGRGGENL